MTTTVPVRWKTLPRLPANGTSVRPAVAEAVDGELDFDGGAFEALSAVSGRRLTSPQREALLPALVEHLCGPPAAPSDAGPLAGTDVLGAVLGLAHFALERPADWVFVRIPEGPTSTPDIWAAHGRCRPWNVELKGVAPLATDVRFGEVLDTCGGRVQPQVRTGRAQLEHYTPTRPVGTTRVQVVGAPAPVRDAGGRALAVSILPDVALAERGDVRPAAKMGCPKNASGHAACRDVCFRGAEGAVATTALWAEPFEGSDVDNDAPPDHGLLPSLHAVVLGGWVGSQLAVDEAVDALVDRLRDSRMDANGKARLLLGALRETGGAGSIRGRAGAIDRMLRDVDAPSPDLAEALRTEGRVGHDDVRPHLLLEQVQVGAGESDVVVEVDGGRWHGRWDGSSLRLAPSAEVLTPRLDGAVIRRAFSEQVVPRLKIWTGAPDGAVRQAPVRLGRGARVEGDATAAEVVTVGQVAGPRWLDGMPAWPFEPSWRWMGRIRWWRRYGPEPVWPFLALASNDGRTTVFR